MGIRDKKPLVRGQIKGEGWAYYYSHYDKKIIPVKRGSVWWLLDEEPRENGDIKLFYPSKLFYGQVIYVPEDHIKMVKDH